MSETLDPSNAPQWQQWITNFDAAAKQFDGNYTALLQQAPYLTLHHPELLGDYYKLIARYQDETDTVNQLRATRDTVVGWLSSIGQWFANITPGNFAQGATVIANDVGAAVQGGMDWLKSAFGLSEYQANRAYLSSTAQERGGLGSLGFAPIVVAIGIAAATAALVVLAQLAKDTYEFSQRVAAIKDLEAKGMSPDAAAATVNATLGAPRDPNTFLGIPIMPLALTAAAIILGPPLIDAFNKRRGV